MKLNKDTATTILGVVIAGATAAEPVLDASAGTLHTGDYVQLAAAVFMAIFGWLTNRKATGTVDAG